MNWFHRRLARHFDERLTDADLRDPNPVLDFCGTCGREVTSSTGAECAGCALALCPKHVAAVELGTDEAWCRRCHRLANRGKS